MRPVTWISADRFEINGTRFYTGLNMELPPFADEPPVVKTRHHIDFYVERFGSADIKTMLEFGIFAGGSLVFWTELFGLTTMVGIDIDETKPDLFAFRDRHGFTERITPYFHTSQDDPAALEAIMDRHFGDSGIDFIVDDASHYYSLSRKAFEIAFPRLKPGGCYVIEDWGWTHWGGVFQTADVHWRDETSMSNLAFELTMACASPSGWIDHIEIHPHSIVVAKARNAPLERGPIKLDDLIVKQERAFALL